MEFEGNTVNQPAIPQNRFGLFTASNANCLEHIGFQLSKGNVEMKRINAIKFDRINIHSRSKTMYVTVEDTDIHCKKHTAIGP